MAFDYRKIKKYLSAPRLQIYEIVCLNNTKRALKIYQTNIQLSQAFYPLLSIVEVILRNAINEIMSAHFSDANWLISQQGGFMVDPALTSIDRHSGKLKQNYYLKKSVAKSIKKIGVGHTQGKIISILEFGFWNAFFDNYHYQILSGIPIQIFSKLPRGTNRALIFDKLTRIRDFRNRVYHNEPIIFDKDVTGSPCFCLNKAIQVYGDIQDVFQWLDLDFIKWTRRINNIEFELKRSEHIFNYYPSVKYYLNRMKLGILYYKKKYL